MVSRKQRRKGWKIILVNPSVKAGLCFYDQYRYFVVSVAFFAWIPYRPSVGLLIHTKFQLILRGGMVAVSKGAFSEVRFQQNGPFSERCLIVYVYMRFVVVQPKYAK